MAGIKGIAQQKLDRWKDLKTDRARWHRLWQLAGEFIHTVKQSFTSTQQPGDYLNQDLFDSTGRKSNVKMSAAMLGMLWQSGGKSMMLQPVETLPKSAKIANYFKKINKVTVEALDAPEAGLTLALEEYMNDQGAFGTSGVGVFKGKEVDLDFRAYGVQSVAIDENAQGIVNTIYIEIEWPLRRIIEEYGINNLSKQLKESALKGQLETKVKVLQAIEPRAVVNIAKLNNLNMPFESIHIEMDTKKILRRRGFEEQPIYMARFRKNYNEIYGRGPGIDALPDVLELNAVKEARMLAQEKQLEPPLAVQHDSMLGGNKIDTSSGAINVFKASDKIGSQGPIFPRNIWAVLHIK